MARLIRMQQWGEVCAWATKPAEPGPLAKAQARTEPKTKARKGGHEGAWLNVNLPALSGPHCTRPWVKALKLVAHGGRAL